MPVELSIIKFIGVSEIEIGSTEIYIGITIKGKINAATNPKSKNQRLWLKKVSFFRKIV